ncbi:MAG: hypothetical protein QW076_02665 [Candidatus Anstonellales archaeon]
MTEILESKLLKNYQKLRFNADLDLKKVKEKFKDLLVFSENEDLITFNISDCEYVVTNTYVEVRFPLEKYYEVANTLLNILSLYENVQNKEFFEHLLEIVGATEFVKNGMYIELIKTLSKENERLAYDNEVLKKRFSVLENTITIQEAQLSELKAKLMDYETIRPEILEQMLIDEIKNNSEFNVIEFSKKNKVSIFQINFVLNKLIKEEKVIQVDNIYYVKSFGLPRYVMNLSLSKIFKKLQQVFLPKKT